MLQPPVHQVTRPSPACVLQLPGSLSPRLPPATQLEPTLLQLAGWEGDSASVLSALAAAGRSLLGRGARVGTPCCRGEQHLHGDMQPNRVLWPLLPQPSSTEGTNVAKLPSLCIFGTIKHFCHLLLARFPRALHQLGTSPRNTVFAQTGSRVGMCGRGVPQLFLLLCLPCTRFGRDIHQPPLPACQL